MIPFGQLQLMNPEPNNLKQEDKKGTSEEQKHFVALAGRGHTRWSEFSEDQMYTFITIRAMAASPLMMGGDLPSLDDLSLSLITNKEMLACNQNGVMGHLVYDKDKIEIWNTAEKGTENGWIGIFNQSENPKSITVTLDDLGLFTNSSYNLIDVWKENNISINKEIQINPNGVVFVKYTSK